jgi:arylsulfatase A-like enzyme
VPVVLITFDHLATSRLGPYGQYDGRTPAFDQLATRSAVFHNALCHAVPRAGTSPADEWWASCPVGLPVRCVEPLPDEAPREWVHRATEAIRVAFSTETQECLWIRGLGIPDPWIPIHAGWEESVAQQLRTTWNELLADESPEMTAERAVRELADEGHFSRSRCPEKPDRDVDRLSLALYQTCVEKLDERVGRLIREYQRHAKPDSLLIVAGLQGDKLPFAWPVHRPMSLHTARVQTPLFVQPGLGLGITAERDAEGATVQELVQTTDIWLTIDDWLHRREELATQGNLLAVAGHQQTAREYVIVRDSSGETLVRTANAQFVSRESEADEEPLEWLTLKPHDAWDLLNVASQNPDLVDQLTEHSKRD